MHAGTTTEVHVRLRARRDHVEPLEGPYAHRCGAIATAAPEATPPLQLVEAHPSDVVAGARVLAPPIAQSEHQRPPSRAGTLCAGRGRPLTAGTGPPPAPP